ncbi:MAG TPA: phosphate-starvation-inducible PsiE family protein [Leptolyngbyaceae cyanobacterium]
MVTSLIATARKIIILDLEKISASELIGLAITIFALSISYGIIHTSNPKKLIFK